MTKFERNHLTIETTGLPNVVSVMSLATGNVPCNLKVVIPPSDVVTLRLPHLEWRGRKSKAIPKAIRLPVERWALLNRAHLMALWRGEITIDDFAVLMTVLAHKTPGDERY